jgi:MalT-like TPR region
MLEPRSDPGQTRFGLLWTMLETYLKPVLSKHRGVALGVWGEAGIGKSYAVALALKNLPCHNLSLHATTPLAGFISTLNKPKKLALWADKTLERVQKGEQVETSNLISALGASLAGLAPFVLHLEDVHEADTERLAFLRDLAQTVQKLKGVGLLVTSRQLPSEPFMAVKLGALAREDSDRLLETELKATLPKEGLEFIYSKASGNPLFTLEYVRFLARAGHLWNDGKNWHWRKPERDQMPVVVEALLEQMIEQAKTLPMHRYVLESKALLPLDAPDELWEKVARVTTQELHTALSELSTQGVFKENGFAHPLVREVTLKTLSSERRQHLARRAINVLKDEPEQAALFVDDAKLENVEVLELLKHATKAATNEALAGKLLAKAVAYATGEEKSKLALEASKLLQHYDVPASIRLLEDLIDNQPENFEAIYLCALQYAGLQKETEAEHVLSKIPQSERKSLSYVQTLIECKGFLDKMSEVIELWEEHAEYRTSLKPEVISHVIFSLARGTRAEEAITLALDYLNQPNLSAWQRAKLLQSLGQVYHFNAQIAKAEEIFSEVIHVLTEQLQGRNLYILLGNRADTRKWLDRPQEAKSDFQEMLRLASEAGDSANVGFALRGLGEISLHTGDYEQAENYIIEGLKILEQGGVSIALIDLELTLCELYDCWGLPQSGVLALKHGYKALQHARELGEPLGILQAVFYTALSEAKYGEISRAIELTKELKTLAKDTPSFGQFFVALAEAENLKAFGQQTEAKTAFAEAYQLAVNLGFDSSVQKIGLELDRLNKDVESARTHMKWFEERGLMNGVNIAKRYFPELATADTPPIVLIPEELPHLEVLGLMQLYQNNQLESIKGSKRQELLALLLEAKLSGRSEVGRLQLLDLLYPEQDELKASSNLRDLVSNLRERMGANALLTTVSGYALGNLESDAELFLKTGDTSLWRGVYLQGLSIEGQETVSESLYLTLFEKAKCLLETNPKEAARLGKMLLEYDPYNRDYLTLCLQAFRESNNHKSLTRLYTEAKERFVEVGETLPVSWQTFLS